MSKNKRNSSFPTSDLFKCLFARTKIIRLLSLSGMHIECTPRTSGARAPAIIKDKLIRDEQTDG